MPQVMIGLTTRDYKTTNEVWRLTKHHLNPMVRRRIGWRGRSSFLRQLILYGFEKASENPAEFLRLIRESQDPMIGKRGRGEAGADHRESLVAVWEEFYPKTTSRARKAKADPSS
ncbi:MAG: hypothetical protein ACYDFT_02840 [Thermoplasmata archaeon]